MKTKLKLITQVSYLQLKTQHRKELHYQHRLQHCFSLVTHYFWTRISVGLSAVFVTGFSALHMPVDTGGSSPGSPRKAEAGQWGLSSIHTWSRGRTLTPAPLCAVHMDPPVSLHPVAQLGKKGWILIPSSSIWKFSLFSLFLYTWPAIFNSGKHVLYF